MALFWHRRDLRLADNVGLAAAGADAPVVPVFVIDPDVLEYASPPRVAFMCDALESLKSGYRERGGDLRVVTGDPTEVLPELAAEYDRQEVVWNRDYSGLARSRDAAVRDALSHAGVDPTVHADALLHEPGEITTNEGEIYSVYSYFWKKWRDREKPDALDAPDSDAVASIDGEDVPAPSELGFADPDAAIPPAGPEAATERLEDFCAGPIYEYEERRDFPAAECTSRLSAHLTWGTIGVRRVFDATDAAKQAAGSETERESVETFQSQLAWREFYSHVLWANPALPTSNVNDFEHDIQWRTDPAGLQAWKDGETGYPIVDAGMRQLRAEGFMHNRLRMIVASFLTKDLLLDWRTGYDWFRERLVDHDTANDAGGWQWAASTGTDAQPYFRVFNPTTQGERYDPDAEYIRTYVSELADVPAAQIHDWPTLEQSERDAIAPEYPAPIVDHATRREEAIAMFEAARGD